MVGRGDVGGGGGGGGGKPIGISRSYGGPDAVVNHLAEMPGAVEAAMQVALLGRSAGLFASGRAGDISDARRQGGEDRAEMLHRPELAAEHHAIAALQAPDTAADAYVHIVHALGLQLADPANIAAH